MAMRHDEFDTSSLTVAQADADSGDTTCQTRALVAIAPMTESSEWKIVHRHAPFLAQLVATKDQHPQTRERRRAEPDVALAAYRATAALAQPH